MANLPLATQLVGILRQWGYGIEGSIREIKIFSEFQRRFGVLVFSAIKLYAHAVTQPTPRVAMLPYISLDIAWCSDVPFHVSTCSRQDHAKTPSTLPVAMLPCICLDKVYVV